jgi:hypothetical protein
MTTVDDDNDDADDDDDPCRSSCSRAMDERSVSNFSTRSNMSVAESVIFKSQAKKGAF